ncbi:tyrosine-type recombinase/integrase [Endozoicomonas atrinae]|nr:tyrosine-type recombinase/integrase [Endozoicomonas atrinae]
MLYIPKITASPVIGFVEFGNVPLSKITPATIKRFLEKFNDKPGARDHIRKTISSAWTWGREYYDEVPRNPCLELKAAPRTSRTRYITDDEYAVVYYIAPSFWKAMMEFAYICRARRIELVRMTHDQILEKGIQLRRAKGSLDEITLWTPRLKKAYQIISELRRETKSDYLFCDTNGTQMKKDTLDSQWQKIMGQAHKDGLLEERFNFHDLKAKGVSDHEGLISGHKTLQAKQVYIRKTQEVKGTK